MSGLEFGHISNVFHSPLPNPPTLTDPVANLQHHSDLFHLGVATRAIERRYQELGGAAGRLGLSVSNVRREPDGSWREDFRAGHLRSLGGNVTGEVRGGVQVRYRGLHCFGTTFGPGDDEPYVVASVYQPEPWKVGQREPVTSTKIPDNNGHATYENVDEGDQKTEGVIDFWMSAPQDIVIVTTLMEHDQGDSQKVKAAVRDALQKGADAGAAAAGAGAGGHVDLSSDTLQGMFVDWLAGAIARILPVGDKHIDSQSIVLKYAELDHLKPMQRFGIIDYSYESPLLQDGHASYKAYYEIFNTTGMVQPHEIQQI
jgi:hypothetical protein